MDVKTVPLDDIVANTDNYYAVLFGEVHKDYWGVPFQICAVNFPFVVTTIGILNIDDVALIKLDEEFVTQAFRINGGAQFGKAGIVCNTLRYKDENKTTWF